MIELHNLCRRPMLHALLCIMPLAGIGGAQAQDYPARPVRIVVPFAPGGSADVYGRFLAQRLQDALGQSFVIDNRPGAGSIIGSDAVAKSAPDGHTLLMMSNTHTVNESLIPNKPFQLMRDFAPVASLSNSDLVLVVKPEAMAGVSIVHIPYKGRSGARSDLLGGQIEMMFDAIPTMVEHIRAGKVRARPELALRFVHFLCGPQTQALRASSGFEF